MKIFLPAIIWCVSFVAAHAQDQTFKINTIKDEDLLQRSLFSYPEFVKGSVHLKGNTTEQAKLNYNRLNDEILFMGNKNDTLALSTPEAVQNIVIGPDVYFYINGGYVQQITAYPTINLEQRSRLKFMGIEKKADNFGNYSNASATDTYTNVKNGTAPRLDPDANQIFSLTNSYYLYDGKNLILANKRAFTKSFPKHQQEINDFISAQHIAFDKRADLEKLLQYATSLN